MEKLQKMRRDEFEAVPKPPEWAIIGMIFTMTCVPGTGCVCSYTPPGENDVSVLALRMWYTFCFASVTSALVGCNVMFEQASYYLNVTMP